MPGVYRLKRCPNCDKEHRKKGNYCSQSCASTVNNTGREQSEETREKITNTVNEYFQTPEGIATGHMVARQNTKRAEINQKIKELNELQAELQKIKSNNQDNDNFGKSLNNSINNKLNLSSSD